MSSLRPAPTAIRLTVASWWRCGRSVSGPRTPSARDLSVFVDSVRRRVVRSGQCERGQRAISMELHDTSEIPSVVELNVGGVFYTTALTTLTKESDSQLAAIFNGKLHVEKDAKGKYFLDRDGVLFRYILDFLRNQVLVLPEGFRERERLRHEAHYYGLPGLEKAISEHSDSPTSGKRSAGYITVGYRGSFAFGRDGLADVKFRKLSRILVCGRVALCRDVFGETLNESRDPDHGMSDRYTSRFFLKHGFIEQAFDMLQEQGFKLAGSCGSGTAGGNAEQLKPGVDSEENRWNHYNEFVFVRE
ncbi:BTB/POZ domain-containing protein KCTD16 [Cephus cinctus]|uniref:BTB/POZ domain-containing protein KCTD16 n=1 Tax=Cephus cinctus TaxID=211228 RepID=A0AAJ7FMY8_CEPCN|nr:BTB/POZ domain-containing protein KCTD16 [Cephus cinctus]